MSTTDQRTSDGPARVADAGGWAVPGVDRIPVQPDSSPAPGEPLAAPEASAVDAVAGHRPDSGGPGSAPEASAVDAVVGDGSEVPEDAEVSAASGPGEESPVGGDAPHPRRSAADAEEDAGRWQEDLRQAAQNGGGAGMGHVHPVLAAVAVCLEALEGVREAGVATLSAREVSVLLRAVVHLITVAFALKLRLVVAGEAQRVADLTGAASTAAFLAHLTRANRPDASGEVRLARDLADRYRLLGQALARGALTSAQVRVCVVSLRRLPKEVTAAEVEECQRFLVHCAATMNPQQLRVVGRRLWEVIDPDGAEAKDGKDLQDEEEQARARAYFRSWRNGDGTTGFRGKLPDAQADLLLKVLHALAAPRRRTNPNIPTSQPDNTTHSTESGRDGVGAAQRGRGPGHAGQRTGTGHLQNEEGRHSDPAQGNDPGTTEASADPAAAPNPSGDSGSPDAAEGHPDPGAAGDWAADPGRASDTYQRRDDRRRERGEGGCDGSPRDGCLDEESAQEEHTGKTIPYPVRLGHALIDLVERLPKDAIPDTGGIAATLVVTLREDQLRTGLGTATLDTGTHVSAAQARRWACGAGLVPVVLDGDSQPLDVGREQRLHTKPMRIAISLRQHGTCAIEGCERPITDYHHPHAWSHGGNTSLANGLGLCRYHHHLAHEPTWTLTHTNHRWAFERLQPTR